MSKPVWVRLTPKKKQKTWKELFEEMEEEPGLKPQLSADMQPATCGKREPATPIISESEIDAALKHFDAQPHRQKPKGKISSSFIDHD